MSYIPLSSLTGVKEFKCGKRTVNGKVYPINYIGEYINNPKLHKIYATRVEAHFDCDTFFPDIPKNFYIYKSSRLMNENNIFYNYNIYKNHLFGDA